MLQLVAAEFQVDLLHVPIDVIVGHALGSPVQRIAAVIIPANWLDRKPADITPGEPEGDARR